MGRCSTVLVVAADAPADALRALGRWLAAPRGHLHAVAVLARPEDRTALEAGLSALEGHWPWMPPVLTGEGRRVGSRVIAVADDGNEVRAAVHDHLLVVTADLERACGAVVSGPGPIGEALRQALVLLARPEDQLLGPELVPIAFPRARAALDAAGWSLGHADLARPAVPRADLRGRLARHARGWSYSVCHGETPIAEVRLNDRPGRALAALVRLDGRPTAWQVYEAARDPRLGWAEDLEEEADPAPMDLERIDARVRNWIRRLRLQTRALTRAGLSAFVPAHGTWAVTGRVEVHLDPELPWSGRWSPREPARPPAPVLLHGLP